MRYQSYVFVKKKKTVYSAKYTLTVCAHDAYCPFTQA